MSLCEILYHLDITTHGFQCQACKGSLVDFRLNSFRDIVDCWLCYNTNNIFFLWRHIFLVDTCTPLLVNYCYIPWSLVSYNRIPN